MVGIPCLNCKAEVSEGAGKLFAEVFVCPGCFLIASRLYERADKDLKQVLVMMKESIRIGLLQGQLQFSEEELQTLSKPDLLRQMAIFSEEAQRNACLNTEKMIPSGQNMPPHVLTLAAAGKLNSSKPKLAALPLGTQSSEIQTTQPLDNASSANDTVSK